MAKFKHEVTNRKVNVARGSKLPVMEEWKSLKCIYPAKCAACSQWISKGAQILWNVNHKLVMHVDC
jgi:hypothetical protein